MKKVLFSLLLLISAVCFSQTYQIPLYDQNGKVILTSDGTKVLTTEGLPSDGYNYTPNPEWIPVNGVTDGEIWILTYTGGTSNLFTITCTTNSGEWQMDIYGGADGKTLLRTYDTASNVALSHTLLTNAGKYCSSGGYYTYKIVLKPKTVGSKLLTMSSITNNTPYLIANIGAASLTTLSFKASENLLYCNFYLTSAITNLQECFSTCPNLLKVTFPQLMPTLITMQYCFSGCTNLPSVTLPQSLPALAGNSMSYCFSACTNLTSILGNCAVSGVGVYTNLLDNCKKIDTIQMVFPALSIAFSSIGLSATDTFSIPTFRASSFILTGTSDAVRSNIANININWSNSNFGGTGNIDIRYNALDATELDRIFTALPTVTGTHVINVASNIGSATCNTAIATVKGWTVTIL